MNAEDVILEVSHLEKSFGSHDVLRDISFQVAKGDVVSVIGDGALTGGMAYEALNNAAELKTNFIIIINDNNMSISKNVGGMSTYLSALRTAETYTGMKIGVTKTLKKIPLLIYSSFLCYFSSIIYKKVNFI